MFLVPRVLIATVAAAALVLPTPASAADTSAPADPSPGISSGISSGVSSVIPADANPAGSDPDGSAPAESLEAIADVASITTDVANPDRGQYLWYPEWNPAAVAAASPTDSYARFTWRELEPTQGKYTFGKLDAELAAAKARGGRFSFRVMPVCSGCGYSAVLPDDLLKDPRTRTLTADDTVADRTSAVQVPDWNSARYLARWASLMTELGRRYDGDLRLGTIDVGGYGNWGEGHNWPYESSYRNTGYAEGSVETLIAITDAVTAAFPKHTVVLNPMVVRGATGAYSPAGTWAVLRSALVKHPKLGLRNDCLGGGPVQQSAVDLLNDAQRRAIAEKLPSTARPLDRWRFAPFVTEWCNNITPTSTDASFGLGAAQVKTWHVSALSNANFPAPLTNYPATQRTAFALANSQAGYRYAVKSGTLALTAPWSASGSTAPSASIRLSVSWVNTGVAPTYRPWRVAYQLRNAAGKTVAKLVSGFNLRGLLGNGSTGTDVKTLNVAALPAGAYRLYAQVFDPDGYSAPMRLGTGNASGFYLVSTLKVGAL